MARAVADALGSARPLLVQAGTGTGKSLAYLVPAVHHAVTQGERVVVSTATIALQRQVVARDLPLVAESLAAHLDRAPRTALLKGWQNYVCRNKLEGGYPEDEPALFDTPGRGATSDLGAQVLRVRTWAHETDTGDRDDLQPGVSERAWRQVSVSKLECLGSKCRFFSECFPENAREKARQADVVVTNHAMLAVAATGSPGALPEHDAIVVDEAHDLADRVTTSATVELSVPVIEHAARLATRHGGLPAVELTEAGARLGVALEAVPDGRLRLGLPDELRLAVMSVRDALRTLMTALKPAAGADAQAEAGTKLAQASVLELFEVAERMLIDPVPGKGDVLWVARSEPERGGGVRLHAAPLGVAGLIAGALFSEKAVVLTSATLTLGGSFEPLARSVGLGPGGSADDGGSGADSASRSEISSGRDGGWRGIDVGSPFDYRSQGIVYVAKHLPEPGREPATESQLDEIAELVTAAGGRTLGLFSSHRAARAAAEAMRERLDVEVLLQGEDQLSTLVAQFAAEETTCLFGTLGLWQGVDVPGRACSLVIIDRLPFPRPDDPVRSARAEAADRAGGNGFMQVSATHAALMLAQAAGRLIRTTQDRGVVAVLDPRLATRRYGAFLTRSMPPLWPATDRETVLGALRRLAALP
ncbi:MAG: ATP-dependent DNA helicase [Actinomycetales bacterium]|nr:ATP-dependent DNA helicase [Actinomycetales bacterium]